MFIEDQDTVWRQVVIALEGGAGKEIVDGFVELEPDVLVLVIEHEVDLGGIVLAHAHFHGIGHLDERE
jgi:hypothetical protein